MPVEQQITADCDDSSSCNKSSQNVLWAISNKLTHSLNKYSRLFPIQTINVLTLILMKQ